MEQLEFQQPASAFTPLDGPSITQLTLNSSDHRRTTLQKWEPGARNSQSHPFVHSYIEEIYIVEGDLTDVTLGKTFEKGHYAYRKPGMEHGPFVSEKGCLMFIICQDVEDDGTGKGKLV